MEGLYFVNEEFLTKMNDVRALCQWTSLLIGRDVQLDTGFWIMGDASFVKIFTDAWIYNG